jgi:hypothetical protein
MEDKMTDTDRPLVSMAQQFTGLPMNALIGGPLKAAAQANATMAVTQTKFILDTGFQKKHVDAVAEIQADPNARPPVLHQPAIPEHDEYQPIMITMSMSRGVITPGAAAVQGNPNATPPVLAQNPIPPSIQVVTTAFNLPLITIIPINSLGVDNVDITFEMEVSSSFSDETTEKKETEVQTSGSFDAKVGWGPFSVEVKGSASYDQKDSSTHSTHYQKSNSAKYTVAVHAGQLPIPNGIQTIIQAYTNAIQPIQMPK